LTTTGISTITTTNTSSSNVVFGGTRHPYSIVKTKCQIDLCQPIYTSIASNNILTNSVNNITILTTTSIIKQFTIHEHSYL
jgi:hypothetical protein